MCSISFCYAFPFHTEFANTLRFGSEKGVGFVLTEESSMLDWTVVDSPTTGTVWILVDICCHLMLNGWDGVTTNRVSAVALFWNRNLMTAYGRDSKMPIRIGLGVVLGLRLR